MTDSSTTVPRIGVIGNGVVGNATARCWMEHATVKVWDKVPSKCTHDLNTTLDSDVVFICLPSPQKTPTRECDTSIIEDFCNMLAGSAPSVTYAIRSTVPVGFTQRMRDQYKLINLVHNPEFLTARCAVTDAQLPARNIIGGEIITGYDICELYSRRFPGVPLHRVTSNESELIKLGLNSFFAVKIAYFNELRSFADKVGCDWSRVMEGLISDGRIAHSHTRIPGPDGKFGFGGACLPKDLANLIHCMVSAGLDNLVTSSAYTRNELIDRPRKS